MWPSLSFRSRQITKDTPEISRKHVPLKPITLKLSDCKWQPIPHISFPPPNLPNHNDRNGIREVTLYIIPLLSLSHWWILYKQNSVGHMWRSSIKCGFKKNVLSENVDLTTKIILSWFFPVYLYLTGAFLEENQHSCWRNIFNLSFPSCYFIYKSRW